MIFHDLLILLVFVWFSRKLFQLIAFPPLFGEIFAGVLAGPLILGAVADSEALRVLSELGIFFLMFHSGMESNPGELYKTSKKALLIALAGIALPFAGGFFVSQWYGYDGLASVFVGLALSVTAVAISARVFKDTKIHRTEVAHVTMTASILTEIAMLVVLALILDVSDGASLNLDQIIYLIGKFGLYFSLVFFIGHFLFPKLYKVLYKGNKGFTFSLILALSFGVVAELLGLHIIIGAFLAGLFLRKELLDPEVYDKIEDRVFGLSYSFLGPIFFATLAFHLEFSALTQDAGFFLLLFLVAVLGKIFGSGLAARFQGMSKCNALGVGIAMNSRGAVDIIIIALGLQLEIIDQQLFSVLILIVFATTLLSIVLLKPLAPSIRDAECQLSLRQRLKHIVT